MGKRTSEAKQPSLTGWGGALLLALHALMELGSGPPFRRLVMAV
jgi:hypothetical protein